MVSAERMFHLATKPIFWATTSVFWQPNTLCLNRISAGRDLERTKTELYYALKTYERLDANAEILYPFDANNQNQVPSTPGYFMRDDVPHDYVLQNTNPQIHEHFNQDLTAYPGSGQIDHHFSDYSESDPIDYPNGRIKKNDKKATSPSGDQYTILLMGFRLVAKSLPNWNISATLLDGSVVNVNFVDMVKGYTADMMHWLAEGCYDSEPYANQTTQWYPSVEWFVYMPDHDFSAPGAHALFSAFPLAQTGNFIWGYNTTGPYLGVPTGFHNTESILTNTSFWKAQIPVVAPNNTGAYDTRALQCVLAAISDSWRLLGVNVTETALYDKCLVSGWLGFYLPLWAYCNNKSINSSVKDQIYTTAKNDMNDVPCYGINSLPGLYVPGWAIGMKWNRSPAEQNNPSSNPVAKGFHNGLDFMLEHNLYYLTSGYQLPEYTNFINFHTEHDYYATNNQPTQYWVEAFNEMYVDINVGPQVDATFRAGKHINVSGEFHAHHNSHVHMYVDPHECALGDDVYKMDNSNGEITAYGFHKLPVESKVHTTIRRTEEIPIEDVDLTAGNMDDERIAVYPNPSEGLFTIEYLSQPDDVHITNSMGQLIRFNSRSDEHFMQIDLADQPNGIYHITAIYNNKRITKKIVKL